MLGDLLLLGDRWCWLSDFSRDVREESGVTGDDSDDVTFDVTGFGVTLGDQDDEEAEGVEDDDDVPREAMDIFEEGVPTRLPLWLLLGVMLEAEELQVKSRISIHTTTFLPECFTCFFPDFLALILEYLKGPLTHVALFFCRPNGSDFFKWYVLFLETSP